MRSASGALTTNAATTVLLIGRFRVATRYISTSCYRVMWRRSASSTSSWSDSHVRPSMRMIGGLSRPAMCLDRTLRSRVVHLRKPDNQQSRVTKSQSAL